MFLQHRSLQQGSWIQPDRLDFYSSPHHILSDQMNSAVELNLTSLNTQLFKNIAYVGSFGHYPVQITFTCILLSNFFRS